MGKLVHAMVMLSLFNHAKFISKNCFSGDSGGGMVLEVGDFQKIIGIVSAALARTVESIDTGTKLICDLNNYLIYTDVSKFYKWINQVVFET